MTVRVKVLLAVLLAVASFAAGRWTGKPDQSVRTVVTDHVVVRTQVQTVTVHDAVVNTATTNEDTKQKTEVITRFVNKAGEVRTVTRIEYRDREVSTLNQQVVTHDAVKQTVQQVAVEDRKVATTVSAAPRWNLSAGVGTSLKLSPVAFLSVQYRLAGPFSVGIWSSIPTTEPLASSVGISAGISF